MSSGLLCVESGEPAPRALEGPRDRSLIPSFDSIYRTYAPFVWRMACRFGVAPDAAEDVMQDVFIVVHRRLPEFEERASLRAWLSAIVICVVRNHRRTAQRKGPPRSSQSRTFEPDSLADAATRDPLQVAERDEAVQELYEILAAMQEERREIFVLAELEELTAPEIAQALQMNVNTVYFRLRGARREFEQILFRRRARDARARSQR
jgi:RNA polymerase sigma-70 factor (ECF subfamily)